MAPDLSSFSTEDLVLLIKETYAAIIGLLCSIILACKMSRHYTRSSNTKKKKTYLFHTAQAVYISLCISYSFKAIDRYGYADKRDGVANKWDVFFLLNWIAFNIGFISLYLFVFLRLYHTFKETKYPISKNTNFYHILHMNLIEVSFTIYALCDYIEAYPYNFVFAAVSVALLFFGLCHLEYLFNWRLFRLICECKLNPDDTLSKKQLLLLPVMVKHTVITSSILGTLLIYVIINGIWAFMAFWTDLEREDYNIYNWSMSAQITVILISMLISFSAFRNWYMCLCSCCDRKVNECCSARTQVFSPRAGPAFRFPDNEDESAQYGLV
eukprot:249860_1